jgi:hypothetical protein
MAVAKALVGGVDTYADTGQTHNCSVVAVLLQWCCSGVVVVLQCCSKGRGINKHHHYRYHHHHAGQAQCRLVLLRAKAGIVLGVQRENIAGAVMDNATDAMRVGPESIAGAMMDNATDAARNVPTADVWLSAWRDRYTKSLILF